MPSWNGLDLGPFARIKTRANRPEVQLTTYPGVNGVGGLNMGSRGFVTEADIVCVGDGTVAGLAAVIDPFIIAQVDASRGTLIDSFGRTWPDVMITEFYPTDEPMFAPGYGWGQEYHIEFFHFD